MPVPEPTVITGDKFSLRLIGPQADVWPGSPATLVTLLQRADMVAYPLPSSSLPTSPDLCTGQYTGRLGDNGDGTLTFPNVVASDGVPWRERFTIDGHKQFVEISYNGELEFVGVIDQQPVVDQTQVQIHLSDGWWLLKKAYARDWIVTQSPRDVIERGTRMWVPATADNFDESSLGSQWTVALQTGGSTYSTGPNSGLVMTCPYSGSGSCQLEIESSAVSVGPTQTWAAYLDLSSLSLPNPNLNGNSLYFTVEESNSDEYNLVLTPGATPSALGCSVSAPGFGGTVSSTQVPLSPSSSYSMLLESDGEWVTGYCNGQLIGCIRRTAAANTTSLKTTLWLTAYDGASATTTSASVSGVLVEALSPFLQAGSDKGDYVLPGDESTYPYGGLTGRYFNDSDLANASLAERLGQVLAPTRTEAYLGSGGPEYMDQTDPQLSAQNPPSFTASGPGPGSSALAGWSAVWFGSVYLKLSQGNYSFTITQWPTSGQPPTALRVWVGKTQAQDLLVDNWVYGTPGYTTFTVSATTLAGNLPYGAGTVARDGWYPIKIEYSVGPTQASGAPYLYFTPPVSYTDPGGTALTGGTSILVPSTSLSPLGCVDQRYQGISHYDLVQQTVQAFGYQAAVEPKQLESGLFPGVLAPRIREGHDTDIILEPDRGPRQDGENLLNYSSGLDATDFAASLFGNGAGLQNGDTGQLQAKVYDVPTMLDSLCDVQQWQDFSDAASPQLLQALLNSQLGLQLAPWQLLSADPNGRPRQAYTWPLPGTVAAMRWRPGDGLRIKAPDINVIDTAPRQMLTFTRNLLPLGIASSQAAFAERPRTAARVLRQLNFKATRWARNYQRQLVQLTGNFVDQILGASDTSGGSFVSLLPNDTIVQAWLRLSSTQAQPLAIYINASALSSTWTEWPLNLNILPWAQPDSLGRLWAEVVNTGSGQTDVHFQILLTVLR